MIPNRDLKAQKIQELWHRGTLDYLLHDGQKKIRSIYRASKTQLFVGECARQFGKSFESVVDAIELALTLPNARIRYATAFHSDLVEFIMPNFEKVLRDCPKVLRPRFYRVGSKWVFLNGAEIKLIGVDRNPDGIRGNALDLIILDESAFISALDYLYKSVIVPATTHRPECRIKMISTPPSSPAHDFLDYAEKAFIEGGYCLLTIYDNPMIDQATIDRLMKESGGAESTTWRREYLCEHVVDSNLAIVPEWNDQYYVEIPPDEYTPFYHRYVAMDLGVRDHTAIIFGHYDFIRAKLIILDEIIMHGSQMTTRGIHKNIAAKEKELWGEKTPYLRVSDNNNPLLLQDLNLDHQMHFLSTDKGRLEEMCNALRMLVSAGSVIVHPRCKYTRGCLKYGVWIENRDKFDHSKVYGHFDALAALIYLVRNLDQSTNPIPYDFKVDRGNQILFNQTNDTPSARMLRQAFK